MRESVKNLGGVLLEATEMNLVDYAYQISEYLYENNYDESDIEEFLEIYSSDDFMNLLEEVDEFMNLNEARRNGKIEPETKTGKNVGSLKGGAKTSAIRRLQKLKQERKDAESAASAAKPSGLTAALKSQSTTASKPKPKAALPLAASSSAPKKRGVLDRIAGAVLKGIERHKAATGTAGRLTRETGKTLSKAASAGSQAAKSFGSGVSSGVRDTATAAKKTKKAVVGEESELAEMNAKKVKQDFRGAGEKIVGFAKKGLRRHNQALANLENSSHKKHLSKYYLAQSFSPEECEIIEKKILRITQESINSKIENLPGESDDKIRQSQSNAVTQQEIQKKQELEKMLALQRSHDQQQGRLPKGHAMEETMIEDRDEDAQERRFQKRGERSRGETATRLIGQAHNNKSSLESRQNKTRTDHPQHANLASRIKNLANRQTNLQKARQNDTSNFRQGPTDKSLR